MPTITKRALARWFAFSISALSLAACDGGNTSHYTPDYEDIPFTSASDREEFVNRFELVNLDSAQKGAGKAENGGSPFGALVSFSGYTSVGYCTVSHVAAGRVATNAHCADDPNESTFFVFYGKDGKKHSCSPTELLYFGSTKLDDVAIYRIPDDCDQSWDVVAGAVDGADSLLNKTLGTANVDVTVWSYDPLSRHSDLKASLGLKHGMVFHPRRCTGFRAMPLAQGVNLDPSVPKTKFSMGHADPATHLFLDRCDANPMSGNSGSLMTGKGQSPSVYGVFHWSERGVSDSQIGRYDHFVYDGSDGKTTTFSNTQVYDEDFGFMHVGTLFRGVLDKHPGLFN